MAQNEKGPPAASAAAASQPLQIEPIEPQRAPAPAAKADASVMSANAAKLADPTFVSKRRLRCRELPIWVTSFLLYYGDLADPILPRLMQFELLVLDAEKAAANASALEQLLVAEKGVLIRYDVVSPPPQLPSINPKPDGLLITNSRALLKDSTLEVRH